MVYNFVYSMETFVASGYLFTVPLHKAGHQKRVCVLVVDHSYLILPVSVRLKKYDGLTNELMNISFRYYKIFFDILIAYILTIANDNTNTIVLS